MTRDGGPTVALPHIVLVGLPGAGKSAVGEQAARHLGRPFLDFDAEIVRRSGQSIGALFADNGEAWFRAVETELTREVAALPHMVLSPGGGWMVSSANRALMTGRARIIHLRVGVQTALTRLGTELSLRPLLACPDPGLVLSRLERERATIYREADAEIDTELVDIQQVAHSVIELASRWGWPVG
jgi:shikimate kinase